MTPQSSFMIVLPIVADRLAALEVLLATMNLSPGRVDPDNSLIPFGRFDVLHEGRLVIIQANTSNEMEAFGQAPLEWQPSLAIMGEADGDKDDILAHLALIASVGLAKILWHCEGFFAYKGTLLSLAQHCRPDRPACRAVNSIACTVVDTAHGPVTPAYRRVA